MSDDSIQPLWCPADPDPRETAEWREAFAAVLAEGGPARARFLLDQLARLARTPAVGWEPPRGTAYVNSIPVERQGSFPGDLAIEERLASIMRWNALAMVVRANQAHGELGGHIASYAGVADLFEVGFNHFFRAGDGGVGGDLVFYQPTRRPVSTPAPSSRGGWARTTWRTTARGSPPARPGRAACRVTRTRADARLLAVPDLLKGDLSSAPDLNMTQGAVQSLQSGAGGTPLIVHTASIAKGNSGGPLVDGCRRVVGINTFINVDQSRSAKINYAIRSQVIAAFLQSAGTSARHDPRPCAAKG